MCPLQLMRVCDRSEPLFSFHQFIFEYGVGSSAHPVGVSGRTVGLGEAETLVRVPARESPGHTIVHVSLNLSDLSFFISLVGITFSSPEISCGLNVM